MQGFKSLQQSEICWEGFRRLCDLTHCESVLHKVFQLGLNDIAWKDVVKVLKFKI